MRTLWGSTVTIRGGYCWNLDWTSRVWLKFISGRLKSILGRLESRSHTESSCLGYHICLLKNTNERCVVYHYPMWPLRSITAADKPIHLVLLVLLWKKYRGLAYVQIMYYHMLNILSAVSFRGLMNSFEKVSKEASASKSVSIYNRRPNPTLYIPTVHPDRALWMGWSLLLTDNTMASPKRRPIDDAPWLVSGVWKNYPLKCGATCQWLAFWCSSGRWVMNRFIL